MIGTLRNFAKTKLAGVLVFIIIIPFVFWGMGSMFNSGNTNNIAKINKTNISTQDFLDYLNTSGVSRKTIQERMSQGIVEELLSTLISTTLLDLEVKDFDIIISESTLMKKIKNNKSFYDENNIFQRTEYEKFLLSNNMTAPVFEATLRDREKQKHLFDYIGAGSITPKFLIDKNFRYENNKLDIEFFPLQSLYKKESEITKSQVEKFINNNKDQLMKEFIDFNYVLLNPKNLIGIDEFNQTFFDKIDFIENKISNNIDFRSIINELELESINVKNFSLTEEETEINDKIFKSRSEKIGLIENENNFIFYNIEQIISKSPDLNNKDIYEEMKKFVYERNKFEFHKEILEKINNGTFLEKNFDELGAGIIENVTLNSVKDNNIFNINSVKILYSLPIGSFTLINDDENNIYLSKNKSMTEESINYDSDEYLSFIRTQLTNDRKSLLKSYDTFLNDKYTVDINQQTLERVKNYFK